MLGIKTFHVITSLVALLGCRSTTAGQSTVREAAPPSHGEGLEGNPFGYPYVDPNSQDEPLKLYNFGQRDYLRFSGLDGDPAADEDDKPIVLSAISDDRSSPFDLEKKILDREDLRPIRLPRKAFLSYLRDLRKRYWRWGPDVNFQKLPQAEKTSKKWIYSSISSFDPLDTENPDARIRDAYSLWTCIKTFDNRLTHWGPLQVHYFCMLPGAFRGCYRELVSKVSTTYFPELQEWLKIRDGILFREAANAACLTHLADPMNPLLAKIVQKSEWFSAHNIKSGKELFDLFSGRTEENVSKILVTAHVPAPKDKVDFTELFDAARSFFYDQYVTIEGQEVNMFEYIMYAPTMQFSIDDQFAILNSFYFDMAATNPVTNQPYWGKNGSWYVDDYCYARPGIKTCSPSTGESLKLKVRSLGR